MPFLLTGASGPGVHRLQSQWCGARLWPAFETRHERGCAGASMAGSDGHCGIHVHAHARRGEHATRRHELLHRHFFVPVPRRHSLAARLRESYVLTGRSDRHALQRCHRPILQRNPHESGKRFEPGVKLAGQRQTPPSQQFFRAVDHQRHCIAGISFAKPAANVLPYKNAIGWTCHHGAAMFSCDFFYLEPTAMSRVKEVR